jgi:hypothetical protein
MISKVICIKDLHFKDNLLFQKERYYEGDFYVYVDLKVVNILSENTNWHISFWCESQVHSWYKFSDYFITLVEWREKQINSILNEC